MIHPQPRPDPGGPGSAGDREAASATASGPDQVASVPRQATGDHPDAYDLYAQIYALRTDVSGTTPD